MVEKVALVSHFNIDTAPANLLSIFQRGQILLRWAMLTLGLALQLAIAAPAGAAGGWTARVVQDGYQNPCQVPGTFPTKAQAVAAMLASNCVGGGAVMAAVLKESPASSLTAKAVEYKYSAADVVISGSAWGCYNWVHDVEATCPNVSNVYADEASAVAAQAHGDSCYRQTNPDGTTTDHVTSRVVPAGDWQNPVFTYFGNLESETKPYDSVDNNPDNGCSDVHIPGWELTRRRQYVCPSGYNGPAYTLPLTIDSVFYCHNPNTGYVTGPLLECPGGKSPMTQVGDPCDVSTGDLSQTESDYSTGGLAFARYYHSADLESHHAMGVGWTHTYAAYLILTNGVPTGLLRPDGHHDAVQNIGGEYVSLSGASIHIQQSGSSWTAYLGDGSSEVYDSTGRLTQLVSSSAQVTSLSYNTSGQLASVVGPFGHSLQFDYDTSGRIHTVTDPSGQPVTYAYDSNGNLTSATYQDGSQRTYLYENVSLPNNLTGIIDESTTRFLTATYNPSTGAVLSSQQADGAQSVSISYNASSAIVTDSVNAVTTYSFTTDPGFSPRATSVSVNGLANSYTVPPGSTDPQRRVTQSTDRNGNVTTYSYDSDHLTSKTEAYGTSQARTTSYEYLAANGALPTLITEPLRQTSFSYYAGTNNLHTKTVTDTATNQARTWTYTYDDYGRTLSVDGPRTDVSDVTSYTYYTCTTGAECGQINTVTDAANHVTTYNTYNAHGQPLTITDPNGVLTTLTYDARQRLTSRSSAGETSTFEYWPTGLLKKATLPDSSYVLYTYDGAHRLTQVSDGSGNKISYTLDGMGNRTGESVYDPDNALHRIHTRVMNSLNQLYQEVNAAGTAAVTTTFGYDHNGNQSSVTAPLARATSTQYDPLNRTKVLTDANSGTISFDYDANNKVTSIVDPRTLTTSFTYSGFGDMLTRQSPDTGSTTRTYDSGGNLASSTDARGATETYVYDGLNRVTSVAYARAGVTDQTVAFGYDAGANGKGHLTSAADANHSLTFGYDALGRVVSKTQVTGTLSLAVGYTYTAGNLTALTTPSGKTVTYAYNTNHQIVGVSVNGIPILSNVTYEPFGAVNGWTWGNGTSMIRAYNADGNVTALSSAANKVYTYDDAARITGISDSADSTLSWNYSYDGLDRLNSAWTSGQSEAFTYDANGNRLTQSGSQNAILNVSATSNRLDSVSGALARTYNYDASGNPTSYGNLIFTYNAAGRVVSAGNGALTTSYVFDAFGHRIKKSSSASTTYFAYDESGHLIGEYDVAGNLIQEIVWLADTPVATVRLEDCGLSVFYIHTDHLNTPRRITRRSTPEVVWSWESDPFGNAAPNENPSGLGTFSFNLRLPGQYYDQETQLAYNWHRDYDSATGRYIESDPLGLEAGVNTYAYASSNPLKSFDVSGLEILCGSYYCGTNTPALGMPGSSEPPPTSPCEWCQGGDKLTIHVNTTTCTPTDTSCFLAMQAAGVPGPYTPHTNYYSKTCLANQVMKLKLTGATGGEAVKKWGPGVFRSLGAAWEFAAVMTEALTSWTAVGVFAPFGIEELGSECQCNN